MTRFWRIRWWQFLAMAALLAASGMGRRTQAQLTPETLKKIKAATVLIEVNTEKGGGSGSGFVLEKLPPDDVYTTESVLVVTNAHVVAAEGARRVKISCVFNSGTRREAPRVAFPVAVDEERDLAILRVPGGGELPEPLDVNSEVKVYETLPVFVLGFPFGELLSTSSRRRPAITISKGTISSIRRDDLNRTALIQVDNGINPGNSGGPVVTESGALIGISVAKIRGADIGFAIPKAELLEMLKGRVNRVDVRQISHQDNQYEFHFTVRFIDPKHNIAGVEIWTVPSTRVSGPMRPGQDGRWIAVASDMQVTKLPAPNGSHTANRVVLSPTKEGDKYLFQVRYETKEGKVHFTAPMPLVIGTTGVRGALAANNGSIVPNRGTGSGRVGDVSRPGNRMPLPGDRGQESEGADDVYVESFDSTITDVVVGGGGRYLILQLGSDDQAIVYDVKNRKKVLTIPVPGEDLIAANMDTIFVISRSEGKFERWSLETLSRGRKGKLPVDGLVMAVAAGSASKKQIVVAWAARVGASVRLFYSLVTPGSRSSIVLNPIPTRSKAVKSYHLPIQVNTADHGLQMCVSADGKTITLARTRVSPMGAEIIRLRKGQRASVTYDHKTYGHLMPTADGRWICTAKGVYSVDLVRGRDEALTVASTHPKYYIAPLEGGTFKICETSSGKVVGKLGPLTELGDDLRALTQSRLAFHERFMLIPQYNAFVSIPLGDDRIAIRDVDLGVAAEQAEADGPRAIADEPFRTWKDRSGKYEVVAKLIAIGDTEITIERKEGNRVQVPISRLSEKDVEYIRQFQQK